MHKRSLGHSGIEASAIGLGTWAMGGSWWGGVDEKAAINTIHASFDAGITLIDTAPAYGIGLSEELVGKAIAGRREQVILATKCGLVWHTNKGIFHFSEGVQPVHRYLGSESIRFELEQSLRRLKTDYIDLYQTHWQDPTTPIEETMSTLLALKQEGKIRAIGVSNATLTQLEEYRKIGPVDSAQEKYSMLDRELEAEFLPYCDQHGIAVLSYSSLALGLLTGKITPDREFTGDDQRRDNPRFSVSNRQRIVTLLAEIQPIAERYQISLTQLVIAWTIHQSAITHALCGARTPAQAIENPHAGTITLDSIDVQAISNTLSQYAEVTN
jgi:methylglyoxal reductase